MRPRDPVDIAGQRRPSGVIARPLNFTVRHVRPTPPSLLMYAYLYDSMITCYTRQHVGDRHVHWYAATSLASMGFVNLLALIGVFGHLHYRWAEVLFVWGSRRDVAAALGMVILGANLFYSRSHKAEMALKPTHPLRSSWPANIYMLLSVGAVLFVSIFLPPSYR